MPSKRGKLGKIAKASIRRHLMGAPRAPQFKKSIVSIRTDSPFSNYRRRDERCDQEIHLELGAGDENRTRVLSLGS
jgi:hypothetical protein